MIYTRPAYMEIDLDLFRENVDLVLSSITPGTKLMHVVKNNAYGFGSVELAKMSYQRGIFHFGVATMGEALELREALEDAQILVFGYNTDDMVKVAIQKEVAILLWSYDMAVRYEKFAQALGKPLQVHIAIDTGMHRLGFLPTSKSLREIEAIAQMPHIEICGTMSHFSRTEEKDIEFTKNQFKLFREFTGKLKERHVNLGLCHMSDSSGIITYPEADLDLVRCGALMNGTLVGSEFLDNGKFETQMIGSLKAQVARVVDIEPGESVSYGFSFVAQKKTRVATLPLGYADGLMDCLTGKMEVLVQGCRCPQIGELCMDMFMIDVTGLDVSEGEEVVLIGHQGSDEIKLADWTEITGRSATYLYSKLTTRIPKYYLSQGAIVAISEK